MTWEKGFWPGRSEIFSEIGRLLALTGRQWGLNQNEKISRQMVPDNTQSQITTILFIFDFVWKAKIRQHDIGYISRLSIKVLELKLMAALKSK